MGMDLSWIALWLNLFRSPEHQIPYPRILAALGILMASIYLAIVLIKARELNIAASRIILFSLLVSASIFELEILADIHPGELIEKFQAIFFEGIAALDVFSILLFTLFVSWRVISLSSRHISSETAVGGFRTGIFMLLGYGFLTIDRESGPIGVFYLFLFTGLLAMSLTRINTVGQYRGGRQVPFSWRWTVGIMFSTLIVLGLALLVNHLTREENIAFIVRMIALLGYILVFLLSPILWLAVRGMLWLFEFLDLGKILEFLVSVYLKIKNLVETALVMIREWYSGIQRSPIFEIFGYLAQLRYLLILAGILLMTLIIVLAMRWYRSGQNEEDDQDYQSLLNQKDLFSLLRDALRKGLERIMNSLEQVFHLQAARRLLAAARIRKIYSRLMKLSARLGNPRPPAFTPLEFLTPLQSLFPDSHADLEAITLTYVKVRYGDIPESSEEMETIEQAWQRILAIGKNMLKSGRSG